MLVCVVVDRTLALASRTSLFFSHSTVLLLKRHKQIYRNLIVWQKSMQLVTKVYQYTKNLPKEEVYGLVSQMRRAAVSIPSNIAEGSRRGSRKDYRNFLIQGFSSGAELETQIEITKNIYHTQSMEMENLLEEVMKMLNKMVQQLK